jgi:maleate isomerase
MRQVSLGWRARIGLLYPETGMLDEEYWAWVPEGVALFIARTEVPASASVEVMTCMAESPEVERLCRGLAKIDVDAIAYACTAVGFIRGVGSDQDVISHMEEASGVRATTTITATVNAFRELDVQRVAVATPYLAEIDEKLGEFLEGSGFEVVSHQGLGIHGRDINLVPIDQVYRLAKQVDRPEADGIFLACTGLRSLEIIEALEQDVGKPVVSANQATMWEALALAGVKARMPGLGQLFNSYA